MLPSFPSFSMHSPTRLQQQHLCPLFAQCLDNASFASQDPSEPLLQCPRPSVSPLASFLAHMKSRLQGKPQENRCFFSFSDSLCEFFGFLESTPFLAASKRNQQENHSFCWYGEGGPLKTDTPSPSSTVLGWYALLAHVSKELWPVEKRAVEPAAGCGTVKPSHVLKTRVQRCVLPRDVRTLTCLPTNGFSIKPLKVKLFQESRKQPRVDEG